MPRLTLASLIMQDHPYFEDRQGRHAHLVCCWSCLSITLEVGDLAKCQQCDNDLVALEYDLVLHLAEGSFDPRG